MKIKASCRQDEKTTKTMTYMGIYGTKRPVGRLIGRTVLFVVLQLLLMLEVWLLGWTWWVISLMAALVLACGLEYWWFFVSPKRRYKALGKTQDRVRTFLFREDSVTVDDALTVAYEELFRVAETKDYIALFRSPQKCMLVEKATVTGGTPEQLCEKLRDILDNRYIICKY